MKERTFKPQTYSNGTVNTARAAEIYAEITGVNTDQPAKNEQILRIAREKGFVNAERLGISWIWKAEDVEKFAHTRKPKTPIQQEIRFRLPNDRTKAIEVVRSVIRDEITRLVDKIDEHERRLLEQNREIAESMRSKVAETVREICGAN